MSNNSTGRQSRREQLETQKIDQAQKDRRNKILYVIAGIVIVGAVVGVLIWGILSTRTGESNEGQVTPPNADGKNGIYLAAPIDGVPTFELFSDYNCHGCRSAHLTLHAALEQAVADKKLNVKIVSMSFLTETSRSAAIAAACSDFQGIFPEFHNQLFIAAEDGLTMDEIKTVVPERLNMTTDEIATLHTCFDTSATGSFVTSQSAYANSQGVTGTPAMHLDGEDVQGKLFNTKTGTYDPDLLRALIEEAGQ